MATLQFNANSVTPSEEFVPVPAGWYQAIMESAELKPTSAGTGSYLSMKFKIMGPTSQERVIFANVTYTNPNEKAVEIGHRQLSAICHSTGVMDLQEPSQLCGKPMMIKVKITPPQYEIKDKPESGIKYAAGNDIQNYKSLATGAPGVTPGATTGEATASVADTTGKPKKPW